MIKLRFPDREIILDYYSEPSVITRILVRSSRVRVGDVMEALEGPQGIEGA